MSDQFSSTINTAIWHEVAEDDNPFVAASCHCYGYDVYRDLLGKAGYIEYLYLLFKGEQPNRQQTAMLELIAVVMANPGPRDPSVHAAMAAYVTGSPAANALTAALAVGAGSYQGAREVRLASEAWHTCGSDMHAWEVLFGQAGQSKRTTIWPESQDPPGFDPYGQTCAAPTLQTLEKLLALSSTKHLMFLSEHREALESLAKHPVNVFGIIAAALSDLAFSPDEAEMLVLILRLPGAAAHALEQKKQGFRQFPFFDLQLKHDPALPNQENAS